MYEEWDNLISIGRRAKASKEPNPLNQSRRDHEAHQAQEREHLEAQQEWRGHAHEQEGGREAQQEFQRKINVKNQTHYWFLFNSLLNTNLFFFMYV